MAKRVYFIIASVLQILLSILVIVSAAETVRILVEQIPEVYFMFPVDFQERMITMIENKGVIFFDSVATISIVLNLFVLKFAISNTILRNKGKIIAISVICFLLMLNMLTILLSIASFIVILCLKRKNPEDFPVRKEIPNLEYQKSTKKELILGFVLLLLYFSQLLIPDDFSLINPIADTIVISVLLIIISIVIFKDKLIRDIKLFKENTRAYIQYVLPKVGIGYVIFIIASLACILISKQAISENQSILESMPVWLVAPLAIIYAPIVEELVFRGVIRRFIKNNILFILVSAIAFGLLHTIHEATLLSMIVMAIPYAILGGMWAYIYAKTDNVTNNILLHAVHNAVGILLVSLLFTIK